MISRSPRHISWESCLAHVVVSISVCCSIGTLWAGDVGDPHDDLGNLPTTLHGLIPDEHSATRNGARDRPDGDEVRRRTSGMWGDHRWQISGAIVILASQSILIAALAFARSRGKVAKSELLLSEARFSGIFHGSPIAISIIRKSNGRILDVNPEWETATGRDRSEFIGFTPIEAGLVSGEGVEKKFRQFLKSGTLLKDLEQSIRTPDGQVFWFSLSTQLIPLYGEPCYVMVAKDVTELRKAEGIREQLAHASRLAMVGEVTASIAHEINQPLGASIANARAAEMLLHGKDPCLGELKQILADISRDNHRACSVVRRVRELVVRRSVRHDWLDVNKLLQDAIALVGHDARRRGVILTQELGQDLPLIQGDAGQLEQVILNLLLNAMDAMKGIPPPGRRMVVRSSMKGSEMVRVCVEDRGHGIPSELIGRIFDSFYTTKDDGMGLGLALAYSVAEMHKGYIIAENNPSVGAAFHLVLPITHDHARPLNA
jgi:PAS domain S-box-containing protein